MLATDPGRDKIALLCNPLAGKGKSVSVIGQLETRLKESSLSFELFTKDWPPDFNGFTSVWLVGGDGTLNYFINRYPSITIPVALFKGGSGNDFAWKLYGNLSIDEYYSRVLDARIKNVDAGICNGKYFINGVGIGFDGEVVKAMGTKRFLSAGHLAYLSVVIRKIFSYHEKYVILEYGQQQRKEHLFMISVANGSRYGGGFLVAPRADISDSNLDIVLIKKIAPLRRFLCLPKVEKGKHLTLSFAECFKEKHITISTHQIIAAHLDGELMEADKFEIHILPGQFHFYY